MLIIDLILHAQMKAQDIRSHTNNAFRLYHKICYY